jgi:hypothetical protein
MPRAADMEVFVHDRVKLIDEPVPGAARELVGHGPELAQFIDHRAACGRVSFARRRDIAEHCGQAHPPERGDA